MTFVKLLLLLQMVSASPADPLPVDGDGDGLTDEFEQELLEKFVPKFLISANENKCDGMPAEFLPDLKEPKLHARNGTIYGQVLKVVLPGRPGFFLEIHFDHLWTRDCGLNGHALDNEHVSALLQADTDSPSAVAWKAEYWYAAAHEDTVCDASHGARSENIDAVQQGPLVWISEGKHASYLDRELCHGGCGGDRCVDMHPLIIPKVINLGERSAPMNGASWMEWPDWSMAEKMQTDFPETVVAKLESSQTPSSIPINESLAGVKITLLVGGSTTETAITTGKKTGNALVTADKAVDTSLDKSAAGVGKSLDTVMTAGKKTGNALTSADEAVDKSLDKSAAGVGNALKRSARGFWKALRAVASIVK